MSTFNDPLAHVDEELIEWAEEDENVAAWMDAQVFTKLTEALTWIARREHLQNLFYVMRDRYGHSQGEPFDQSVRVIMSRCYERENDAWRMVYGMALGNVSQKVRDMAQRLAYNRMFYHGENSIKYSLSDYPRQLSAKVRKAVDPDQLMSPVLDRLSEDAVAYLIQRGLNIRVKDGMHPAIKVSKDSFREIDGSSDTSLYIEDSDGDVLLRIDLVQQKPGTRTEWMLQRCCTAIYETFGQKPPEDEQTFDEVMEKEMLQEMWGGTDSDD